MMDVVGWRRDVDGPGPGRGAWAGKERVMERCCERIEDSGYQLESKSLHASEVLGWKRGKKKDARKLTYHHQHSP